MAEAVLLDSFGLIATLNQRDHWHEAAKELWLKLGRRGVPIVISDWIIAETGNGLARTASRGLFVSTVRMLQTNAKVHVVNVEGKLLDRALQLYEKASDKGWGLVDCSSFELMRALRLHHAFTGDRHFQQAGFTCLLDLPRTKV